MKIYERIDSAKRKLADYLNQKVNGLSISQKRLTLVLFGLLFASICIVQVIRSLQAGEKDDSFSVERITLPESIHKSFSQKGYGVLDSLIHKAPGLMDSVNMLIHKYQSH